MDPLFMDWAFKALVSGAIIYGVKVLAGLQSSVEKLNVNVAVVIEKVSGHEKVIDGHDSRIRVLEKRGD